MFVANDSLIVPATKQPTWRNRDAAVGFFVGSFILSPLVGLVGAAIGGFMGKQRMAQEQLTGHVVKKPSVWNKSLIIGAGLGQIAANLIGGAILLTMVGSASLVAAIASPVVLVAMLAGPVIGGYIGAKRGKQRMEAEYREAEMYVAAHGNFSPQQSITPPVVGNPYQVTLEEAATLESRLKQGKPNFTGTLANQAELDTAQGAAR